MPLNTHRKWGLSRSLIPNIMPLPFYLFYVVRAYIGDVKHYAFTVYFQAKRAECKKKRIGLSL